jgi:hypothetical protein
MSAPYEVLAQPFTLYLAPEGSTFPLIDADPTAPWVKIGSSGDLNYTEDGVTVTHNQTVETFRALGSTGPRKAFRTEEELHISLTLADVTLEEYAKALEHNTVSTNAASSGVAGYKELGLSRGLSVERRALLVKSPNGPYGDGWPMQYEVPVVVQIGEPEVVYVKGEPAGIMLEFLALEDPDAGNNAERFGRILAQNADPTT